MKRYQLFVANLFTFFEHYDKALFTLCIPFLSPLFLPAGDPLTQLIWGYTLIPITTCARPLGAWIFGKIGDRGGIVQGLKISALGIGLSSIAIALLPSYDQIGLAATGLLIIARMAQNLCFAGQTTGGALLALNKCDKNRARMQSGFFQSLGALGALAASLAITAMLAAGFSWRILFAFGGLTVALPHLLPNLRERPQEKQKATHSLPHYLAATLVCGFVYGNYKILTAMLSGLLPLITPLSPAEVMGMNTAILAIDLSLIALFGWLFSKVSSSINILLSSCLLALLGPLLFPAFAGSSYLKVFMLRLALITPACWLTAPFYAWLKELAPPGSAYTFIGLSKAIGLGAMGAPAPAFFLALYQWSGLTGLGLAYSLFSLLCTAGALIALRLVQKPRIV